MEICWGKAYTGGKKTKGKTVMSDQSVKCFTPIKWPLVWRFKYERVIKENIKLEELLQKALKNDNRDPVTGRYESLNKGTFRA